MINFEGIIIKLKSKKVGVLVTDTLYGLVGSALIPEVVERIYRLKKRDPRKPLILLIGSIDDLAQFGIKVTPKLREKLNRYWPGKVSIILPCNSSKFDYLHRGTDSIAFRLPEKDDLCRILEKTGPLVAPSANPEGMLPAETITQARIYFNDLVDFYVDEGKVSGKHSKLIKFIDDEVLVLRK